MKFWKSGAVGLSEQAVGRKGPKCQSKFRGPNVLAKFSNVKMTEVSTSLYRQSEKAKGRFQIQNLGGKISRPFIR